MGSSKAEVRATYDRIAESYAAARTHPWREVVEFVASLPARSRILDLGCGHGRHARPAASEGHRVVGLDFSKQLLAVGRRASRSSRASAPIGWIQGEANALPFRDASFDAALCIAVLHHLPSRSGRIAALRELSRILSHGSRAFVSVWARDDPYLKGVLHLKANDSEVEIPWNLSDGSAVPRFYHLFSEGELEGTIIESGLHGERFFRGSGNYFAVMTKHG